MKALSINVTWLSWLADRSHLPPLCKWQPVTVRQTL